MELVSDVLHQLHVLAFGFDPHTYPTIVRALGFGASLALEK